MHYDQPTELNSLSESIIIWISELRLWENNPLFIKKKKGNWEKISSFLMWVYNDKKNIFFSLLGFLSDW